jgi:hypothetical protein
LYEELKESIEERRMFSLIISTTAQLKAILLKEKLLEISRQRRRRRTKLT